MAKKVCTKCKEEKPLSRFHKDKTKKKGCCSWCKTCVRIKAKKNWALRDIEKVKARKKQYVKDNREKLNAYNVKYRIQNNKKVRAQEREYYAQNAERLKLKNRQYYYQNRLQNAGRRNAGHRKQYYKKREIMDFLRLLQLPTVLNRI